MKTFKSLPAIALLSSSALIYACSPAPDTDSKIRPADSFFTASGIYSGLSARADIEAIAVDDGEIICAGTLTACEPHIDNGTNRYAIEGYIYPGFTDGHAHLLSIGRREMMLNLDGAASIADMKTRVAEYRDNLPDGAAIIYGRGWIETHYPEARFPTRQDLDEVSTEIPIVLGRADGHATVANSKALDMAGIDRDTPDPFGGAILKDANGEPTGMLIDTADQPVMALIPNEDEAFKRRAFAKASEVYNTYGWTGIHYMSVNPDDVPLMEDMAKSGELSLRVYNSLDRHTDIRGDFPHSDSAELVTTRAIKLYSDGALGSRGAALLAPYSDDPGNVGLVMLKEDETLELLTWALREGVQINTHAIGDRGNRMVLDLYEDAFAAVPAGERKVEDPRWRIEHAQILELGDLQRFAAMGVIPSMQPSHAIGDLHFAVDRLGVERLAGGYAWRDLIDSGVIIAGGSDAPVEKGDSRIEFYAAVARKDAKGFSGEGWYPEQAVTRHEALKMFTIWPAYAAFEEDIVGTIEVGKRADFTVLKSDIMTIPESEILTLDVLGTVVDGKVMIKN